MVHFKRKNILFSLLLVLLLFVGISIFITYPLIFHLGDFSTGTGDELLIAWIHSWVMHALLINPLSLFNANIYYPYHNSLAFSDIFITGSLLTAPFVYVIGQPIAANNITIISSLALLGFTIYLLAYYLSKNNFASILSGFLIIFSPASLSNTVQIQMLEIYWVPLAILFFLLFFDTNKSRYLFLTFLCFLLQFYNSFLPAYFILFSLIIIFLFKWLENKKKCKTYFTRKNIVSLLLTFILLLPVTVPYIQVSHEFHYARDLRDSIHFALQPEDLLYPGVNTKLRNFLLANIPTNHYSQNNEFKTGYLGFIFSLLIIGTIIYLFRNRKTITFYEKNFITIALTGLILSFGPFLHLNRQTIHYPFPIPLPYLVFYYIMPGFQGFRNSQRWEMLFIIGAAILISLAISRVLKNFSIKNQLFIFILLAFSIVIEFSPMSFISIPQKKDFPKIYSWMPITPKYATFIMLPIYNWNMPPNVEQELFREYYSTIEFRPMVNGYSGFSPPPWQDFIYFINKDFPKQNSINALSKMRVNYIIIDQMTYDKEHKLHPQNPTGKMIVAGLKKNKSLHFIRTVDTYSVFAIHENNVR
jgi:hypothetical protein